MRSLRSSSVRSGTSSDAGSDGSDGNGDSNARPSNLRFAMRSFATRRACRSSSFVRMISSSESYRAAVCTMTDADAMVVEVWAPARPARRTSNKHGDQPPPKVRPIWVY